MQPTLLGAGRPQDAIDVHGNKCGRFGAGRPPAVNTLRWAVEQANAATTASSIEIELGTSPATITLLQGQLELDNTAYATTIYDGPGEGAVTISGNDASRVFQVDGGVTASISGLTITGGDAPATAAACSTSARLR